MKNFDIPLAKSISILAFPAILEMALHTLLGIADTIMISRMINSSAVSAAGYSNQIMYMLIFIFTSFNTGAIAMISRSYGEKNLSKANHIANQNLALNLILGIIITLISIFAYKQIFAVYDITTQVRQYAYSYFNIIAWGIPFMFISFSLAASLRGIGNTKTPMKITAFANLVNVILNYLLIKGIWIFPQLGIEGAAIATAFSRFLAAFLLMYVFIYKNEYLNLNLKYFKFTKKIFNRLWQLSYPGAIEQFFMQGSFVAVGIIISQLSTLDEASFRILITIESFSFMPAVGISIATATLVGKALGERNNQKSLHSGYIATGMAALWGIIIGSVFLLIPQILLSPFTNDQTLIHISIATIMVAGVNQPLLNSMIVLTGALRGAGDTKFVMNIVTLRLWLIFVPLSYLFVITLHQGVKGMWFAEIISFIIFLPIVLARLKEIRWNKIEI